MLTDNNALAQDQFAEQAVMVCPQCEGEGSYADGLDEAACATECTRCGSNGWIVDLAALRTPAPASGEVGELVEAAAALNIATDGREELKSERTRVLKAIERLAAGQHQPKSYGDMLYASADEMARRMGGRFVKGDRWDEVCRAGLPPVPADAEMEVVHHETGSDDTQAALPIVDETQQPVRRRKPQNPKHWPPIDPAEIEARIDALCGCDGRCDCNCISVFGPARMKAWEDYNS